MAEHDLNYVFLGQIKDGHELISSAEESSTEYKSSLNSIENSINDLLHDQRLKVIDDSLKAEIIVVLLDTVKKIKDK